MRHGSADQGRITSTTAPNFDPKSNAETRDTPLHTSTNSQARHDSSARQPDYRMARLRNSAADQTGLVLGGQVWRCQHLVDTARDFAQGRPGTAEKAPHRLASSYVRGQGGEVVW